MSLVQVNAFSTTDVFASGTYTVQVNLGIGGVLNIAGGGTPATPIAVTVNGLTGIGLLYSIDVSSYAALDYAPTVGLSIGASFNIGKDADGFGSSPGHGTLELDAGLTVSAVSSVKFSGTNNTLILDNGLNLGVLDSGISGWASGDIVAF